ncbi:uncharacterized protein CELE_T21G5.2 [Caenorhabditis elegans]|uniref:Transmembrane protein n=1 Tax=Caenorhabditis elegans TaxID=6239 RepID=O02062_CAEEL|nr:Transmembrane protein [Caenorhabditis elegans]CCD67590.1 Transmembrane protein [Caenorhabditis elegans]|eukprot:NP_491964.2 Uncharacterized protein CELE_T21G5.2 [Caenorhabditis elegans]
MIFETIPFSTMTQQFSTSISINSPLFKCSFIFLIQFVIFTYIHIFSYLCVLFNYFLFIDLSISTVIVSFSRFIKFQTNLRQLSNYCRNERFFTSFLKIIILTSINFSTN